MQKTNPRLAALNSDCMDVNGRSLPLKDKNVAGEMAKSVLALQAWRAEFNPKHPCM